MMARPSVIPVGGEVVYREELPAVASSVPWARRQAREVLSWWQVPPRTIETLELLLTEIVTNAIRYGGSQQAGLSQAAGDDRVTVTLRHMTGELLIEVCDCNQIPPVLTESGDQAEGWRGLNIVNDLSRTWGYYDLPLAGKAVYCVVVYE